MTGHGGRRLHCAQPMLSHAQVAEACRLYAQRVPYKIIALTIPASRYTLHRAIHGVGPYRGYPTPCP